MKICTKCNIEKPKTEFGNQKANNDGLYNNCRKCVSSYNKVYRDANSVSAAEYKKEWYIKNKQRLDPIRKKYSEENAESARERSRIWYSENRDRALKACRAYRISISEKISAYGKKYKHLNREKVAAHGRNRRAIKKQSAGKHTHLEINKIVSSQRGLCAACEKKLVFSGKNKFHVDHITPLSRGGANDKYNLQCLCPSCNLRKHAKDPIAWANENGKLL